MFKFNFVYINLICIFARETKPNNMKNKIAIALSHVAFTLILSASCGDNANRALKASSSIDTVCTIENIKNICGNDPHKALALLDSAEQYQLMKQTDIDGLRAVIYQNSFGQTDLALTYAKRVYDNPMLKGDTVVTIKALKAIMGLSYQNAQYSESLKYAKEGSELARKANDKKAESNFLLMVGYTLSEIKHKDEAIEYINRGLAVAEAIPTEEWTWYNADDIFHAYLQKQNIYMDEEMYDEFRAHAAEMEKAMDVLSKCKDMPEAYMDKRICDMNYLLMTFSLITGDMAQAKTFYDRMVNTKFAKEDQNKRIALPYLIATKQYADAHRILTVAKRVYAASRDTINRHYIEDILRQEVKLLEAEGSYKAAVATMGQIAQITDSLMRRSLEQKTVEMAAIYDTADKQRQIVEQDEKLRNGRIIVGLLVLVVVLMLVAVGVVVRYNSIIRRKNRVAVATIDELLQAKDELSAAKDELTSSKDKLTSIHDKDDQANDEEQRQQHNTINRLKDIIESQKLYLDPDFDRSKAEKLVPSLTARFISTSFNKQEGMSFPRYINNLRLDYSLRLLRQRNELSIEGVALESGFSSRQTFHRLFIERFTITPSEYKNMK